VKEPPFRSDQIRSIDDLIKYLDIQPIVLSRLISNIRKYYSPNPIMNIGDRQTFTVLEPLKGVQERILLVLKEFSYPPYLHGGLKGTDYIKDASTHAGSKIIIHEDVSHFFDNISPKHIFSIWHELFRFPLGVAKLLTSLTTVDNKLPQGATSSTYLSNLVFWRYEPGLVEDFESKGWKYSRFVDDIQVSSKLPLSREEKSQIISGIFGMMSKLDLKPKRTKHSIQYSNRRLSVHGLNLNIGKPTITRKNRGQIRAALKQLEDSITNGISLEEFTEQYNSLSGRIQLIKRLHLQQGEKLFIRLVDIKNKYINPT
jgi:hypothetical protein